MKKILSFLHYRFVSSNCPLSATLFSDGHFTRTMSAAGVDTIDVDSSPKAFLAEASANLLRLCTNKSGDASIFTFLEMT
jgi:hypothetical protein